MNKLCPYCKKPVEDSAIFCPHCNLQIAEHKAPMRKTTPTLPKQVSPTLEKEPLKNTASPTTFIVWGVILLTIAVVSIIVGIRTKNVIGSSADMCLVCGVVCGILGLAYIITGRSKKRR